MEVIGVDFSGAKGDNRTWIAKCWLHGKEITLSKCHPIGRDELADSLAATSSETVTALDFPFSVPLDFARQYYPNAKNMADLWDAFTMIELDDFVGMRDEFVASQGEVKRLCDSYYPESFSCLHKTNPNMVPMTFYGMRMLSRLRAAGCDIPPLKPQDGNKSTLLEVMPGAVLRALKLPFKGYKSGAEAGILRQHILNELPTHQPIKLRNLDEYKDMCMNSDDCLDSIIAAIAAALWVEYPKVFRVPESEGLNSGDPVIQIEGWLYAPALPQN